MKKHLRLLRKVIPTTMRPLAAVFVLAWTSPGLASSPPTTIAVVNGEPVPVEQVARTLSRSHQAAPDTEGVAMDLDRLLFKVINDVLLAQEARAMGMHEDEPVVQEVADYRRRLAKRKLEAEEITSRSEPTEEEIRRFFESRYRRVTFRVVTAYDQSAAAGLLEKLQEGADMESLAEQESVDPYRARGGLVDDIEHVDLQMSIADLLFSLDPGELGGPVQTSLGYSIVKPESFAPPAEGRFEEVEKDVRAVVRMNKARRARRSLGAKLLDQHSVEIDQAVVDAMQPSRRPDGRLVPTIAHPEDTVLRIDGNPALTAAELGKELLSRWKGVRNEDAARVAAPIVLTGLVDEALLQAEAEKRGYDKLPEVERAAAVFESDLLVSRYLTEVVQPQIEVRPEEMRSYYEAHKEELHRPPRVRLGQVTVATLALAEKLAQDLRAGADLAWVVKQHSIDGFKQSGGDRGWYELQPGVPDFNKDLFEAEVGVVLDPIGEPGFWVVLKVLAREEQGIYDYDEISGNIRDKVLEQKTREELDKLITTLRDRSEVEIDIDSLDQLRITGLQSLDTHQGDGLGHQ